MCHILNSPCYSDTTDCPIPSMAWHKGTWWPLYVKEWYAPKSSQHMFDPYSFCLLVLGLVFHLLWGTDNIDNWIFGFLLAIILELIWEVIGNSQFVLKRIRDNSGTSGEYIGKVFEVSMLLSSFIFRRLHSEHFRRYLFLCSWVHYWYCLCSC